MIVVADTSPLLHLARIGRLELVVAAVGPVLLPRTVWSELIQPGTRAEVVDAVRAATWIEVRDDPATVDLGLDQERRRPSCSPRNSRRMRCSSTNDEVGAWPPPVGSP